MFTKTPTFTTGKSLFHHTKLAPCQRAFPLPNPQDLWSTHEHPHLMRTTYRDTIHDGIWICCCGSENAISHMTGPHPFLHLTCNRCSHVYCNACVSSAILTPITTSMSDVMRSAPTMKADKTCMGQICPECGLTHVVKGKALKLDVKCACGSRLRAMGGWIVFMILSPDGYRFDPNKMYVQLKSKWIESRGRDGDMMQVQSAPQVEVGEKRRDVVMRANTR